MLNLHYTINVIKMGDLTSVLLLLRTLYKLYSINLFVYNTSFILYAYFIKLSIDIMHTVSDDNVF